MCKLLECMRWVAFGRERKRKDRRHPFRSVQHGEDCSGKYCFHIRNHPSSGLQAAGAAPEISILGTTGVELCAGLHWYIKYWCGAHVSWDKTGGAQLFTIPPPGSLPQLQDGGTTIHRVVEWNYYQNVVTSSCT
jgi:alpha-N-acetylglucosaminidase